MSAKSKFYDEVYKIYHSDTKDFDHIREIIRDKWVKEKKYSELISYILDDYGSRNCVEFMTPLVKQLTEENRLKLYKRIWKPVIRHNAENFWVYEIHNLKIDYPSITWDELEAIDTSHIKPYGNQTDDEKENAAFWGKYYLNAIKLCKSGLDVMGDKEEVKNFEIEIKNVYNLKQQPPEKKKKKAVSDKRKIDDTVFWELINDSRKETETKDDFLEVLSKKLEGFKPTELKRFQKLVLTFQNQLNHWDIWALAYIVRRGCGDDCFDYFRLWIVSKGKEVFEAVKNNDSIKFRRIFADEDPTFEEFEYLTEEIYEEITDKEMKQPSVRISKIKGKEWDEDKICDDYPELCKIFDFKTP